MKISKKIFGVALALIMIFNVFAVGTFAAVPADTLVQLNISTDKAVYAPGDTVVIMFSEQCIDELGEMLIGGQYDFGYNSAVLEPISTATELSTHNFTPIQAGSNVTYSVFKAVSESGVSPLYDWDAASTVAVVDDGTAFDATAGVDLFTIEMKIKADAPDGTYTIGYNPVGYENYTAFSNDNMGFGGLAGPSAADYGFSVNNMYAYGTCTFTVSSAPAVEVTHDGTQARYAYPGTPSAAAYQFGCLGKVTGLTVETDADNNVTNIQSIVATANYNGSTVSSEVATMWVDGEAYGFRAVFKGFDYQDTKDITVTFAITMADGTTVYTTAEAATYTANGIYTAAVGRGMPEIA